MAHREREKTFERGTIKKNLSSPSPTEDSPRPTHCPVPQAGRQAPLWWRAVWRGNGRGEAERFVHCGSKRNSRCKVWWGAGWYGWPKLPHGPCDVWACTAGKGHVWVCGPTAARVCVDVHVLLPKATGMPRVWTSPWGNIDVSPGPYWSQCPGWHLGPGYCWGPCLGL